MAGILDKKVGEAFGNCYINSPKGTEVKDLLLSAVRVGLELEVEGLPDLGHSPPDGWNIVTDGSLRNMGREFVLNGPHSGETLELAIKNLTDYFKYVGGLEKNSIKFNWRTSLHVHLDQGPLRLKDVGASIITYCIFEDLLLDYCDISRRENMFCIPLHKAGDDHVQALADFIHTGTPAFGEDQKYYALHVGALKKYGTLEYRMHHGTDKYSDIVKWINILFELRTGARKLSNEGTLGDLPSLISSHGLFFTFKRVFPKTFKLLKGDKTIDQVESSMLKGIRFAQQLIY